MHYPKSDLGKGIAARSSKSTAMVNQILIEVSESILFPLSLSWSLQSCAKDLADGGD
jgi:hypothetical protein